MKRLVLRFAVAAVLISARSGVAGDDDEIDKIVAAEMAARKIPGLALSVVRDGRVIKRSDYGLASIELNVPVTRQTVFPLASMTKEITAAATLALVESGTLRLDTHLGDVLDDIPSAWKPVTIAHLLSHTSGLPSSIAPDTVNVIPIASTREALYEQLRGDPVRKPGTAVAYNGTAYPLLGRVIEKVSGQSFESFILDRLLAPHGINEFTFGDAW